MELKVLSYWKGEIEISQIVRPASLVWRDNSTEILINSNIIVFTPVIFFCVCWFKRVESKQLCIQHQVILLIVEIGHDFISIHELTEPTLKKSLIILKVDISAQFIPE